MLRSFEIVVVVADFKYKRFDRFVGSDDDNDDNFAVNGNRRFVDSGRLVMSLLPLLLRTDEAVVVDFGKVDEEEEVAVIEVEVDGIEANIASARAFAAADTGASVPRAD